MPNLKEIMDEDGEDSLTDLIEDFDGLNPEDGGEIKELEYKMRGKSKAPEKDDPLIKAGDAIGLKIDFLLQKIPEMGLAEKLEEGIFKLKALRKNILNANNPNVDRKKTAQIVNKIFIRIACLEMKLAVLRVCVKIGLSLDEVPKTLGLSAYDCTEIKNGGLPEFHEKKFATVHKRIEALKERDNLPSR